MTPLLRRMGQYVAVMVVVLGVAIAVLPRLLLAQVIARTPPLPRISTIIVTGANSGVGLASVQHLARMYKEQATIIMACRDMSKCGAAKQEVLDSLSHEDAVAHLVPMTLDLGDRGSIARFARELGRDTPVDILMNNAGVAGATVGLSFHHEDGVENHIRVNHLGHMYLTHLLWSNLQRSASGQPRVVVVASITAASANATLGWYEGEDPDLKTNANLVMYGRSKRANLMFAAELHQRFGSLVSVRAAHPGLTHTNLCVDGCKGSKPKLSWIQKFSTSKEGIASNMKMTAEQGALSQVYAALVPQSNIYVGPTWWLRGQPAIVGQLNGSWHHFPFTQEQSNALWEKSMAALAITEFGDYVAPKEEEGDIQDEILNRIKFRRRR